MASMKKNIPPAVLERAARAAWAVWWACRSGDWPPRPRSEQAVWMRAIKAALRAAAQETKKAQAEAAERAGDRVWLMILARQGGLRALGDAAIRRMLATCDPPFPPRVVRAFLASRAHGAVQAPKKKARARGKAR